MSDIERFNFCRTINVSNTILHKDISCPLLSQVGKLRIDPAFRFGRRIERCFSSPTTIPGKFPFPFIQIQTFIGIMEFMVKVICLIGDMHRIHNIINFSCRKIIFCQRTTMHIDNSMRIGYVPCRISFIGSIVLTPIPILMERVAWRVIAFIRNRIILDAIVYLVFADLVEDIDLVGDPLVVIFTGRIERCNALTIVIISGIVEVMPFLRQQRRVVLESLEQLIVPISPFSDIWRIAICSPEPLRIAVIVGVEFIVVKTFIDKNIHCILGFFSQNSFNKLFCLRHR